MTTDELFFFEWAGFSYDPKTETPEQGKARCAVALAHAESVLMRAIKVADVSVVWDESENYDNEPCDTCEACTIWFGSGFNDDEVLASLSGITDASPEHRRVIRAELASECLERLNQITKGA